jgi:iron complex outermembrane receptor protein
LEDALVQRRDLSGADFFVNAGDIKQKGIEFHGDYKRNFRSFIKTLFFATDLTFNDFHYGDFVKGTDDFSGKKVPSVPSTVVSLLTDLTFAKGIYLRATYYGAGEIFLNDANTAKAEPYHLLGGQLGWKVSWAKNGTVRFRMNVYVGADNLLDETYSLGNDINAAAGRYYNAAPTRNYYVGVAFSWIK